jgi:capsular exopolysaccharide synthesis family protein
MDLQSYLCMLGRRWWALAAGLVIGLVLGYLAFSFLGLLPVYSATSTVLVTDTGSTASSDPYGALVLTYAELARQDAVTQAVAKALGLPISAREVARFTEVHVIPETRLMEITVTHRDPQIAAAVANEVARQLADQPWVRAYRLQIVSPAVLPDLPNLAPYVNVLLAGMLGLFLVAGLVFLREYLADTAHGASMVASRLAVPVLGTFSRKTDVVQAIWPLVELCKHLGEEEHRRLLITSPALGEGKSTLAQMLATAWTRAGYTAILVDAHVQRPILHERLGCPNDVGLTDWLALPDKPIATCQLSDGLALLPSGSAPTDPIVALAAPQWPAVLAALDQQADMVIIDGPPVLPAAEIAILAPQVDGILMVLCAGRTKLSAASEALEALDLVDGPILGLVLNGGKEYGK